MKKGQISLTALALITTISAGIIGGISAWILKVDTKAQIANDGVAEIKAEIAGMKAEVNTKLDFILGKYGVNYNNQTQKVEPMVKK